MIKDGIKDQEYSQIITGVNKKYNKMHGMEEKKKKETKKERPEKLSLEEQHKYQRDKDAREFKAMTGKEAPYKNDFDRIPHPRRTVEEDSEDDEPMQYNLEDQAQGSQLLDNTTSKLNKNRSASRETAAPIHVQNMKRLNSLANSYPY